LTDACCFIADGDGVKASHCVVLISEDRRSRRRRGTFRNIPFRNIPFLFEILFEILIDWGGGGGGGIPVRFIMRNACACVEWP